MNWPSWSWAAALQQVIILHPETLLLAAATYYFFFLLFSFLLFSFKNRNRAIVDWPVVGMLPTIITNNDRLLDHAVDALREGECTMLFRGPRFCGIEFLLTCDPDNANHMFNLNFANYPKGGGEFSQIFDILGDGIFSVDGDSWAAQRRMAHTQMSHRRFRSSVGERTRDKVASVLLPLMDSMSDFDKVVDLSDVFMRFTFDTTHALVLGNDPGCLAPEFPNVPFAKALDHIEQVLLFRHIVPPIWWKLLRWLRVGEEKKMAEAKETIDRLIEQCIREKREGRKQGSDDNDEGPVDLLTPYIDCSDDKFLRDTLLTFLSAGKDTTGAAMSWFFWLVANHPDVEEKILKELSGLRKPVAGDMRVFDAEETDTLVYLHAALCETLRLYPSVPFNHKVALKDDVLPSGHRVPPGRRVIFCMYATGRMEGIWGKDCLEFKPERWITEKGSLRHEPSHKFVAFHSGPRSCLGKNMAFTLIKLLAAAMIYNFKIQVVEGHVPEPKISIVLQAKNGLLVKLKRRRSVDIDG